MSATAKSRVLLVDDHAMVRAGLRALINATPDIEVVGEAADGEEAVARAKELKPDVVVLDLTLPGMGGIAALKELRRRVPQARVLVLTMHDDEAYLQQVLKWGGAGYLVKKAPDMELLLAIRAVVEGGTYVHSSLTGSLVQRAVKGAEAAGGRRGGGGLTPASGRCCA